MHAEIMTTLHQAQLARQQPDHRRLDRFLRAFSPGQLTPEQCAALLSPDQFKRLQAVERRFAGLERCIQALAPTTLVYPESATSRCLAWDTSHEHLIVVRLSLYGPLAWIGVVGPPPPGLLDNLDDCLRAQGLLRLSPADLAELQARKSLNLLFQMGLLHADHQPE